MLINAACPLCGGSEVNPAATAFGRELRGCATCSLLFVAPGQRIPRAEEVARYEQHDNRADDPRYVAHLRRLADPVLERTRPGARGLDYGCGPAPVLGAILTDAGRPTASYDPHFRNEPAILEEWYDVITCCEVLEHVHEPARLLRRFDGMLALGGIIGIMTGLRDDTTDLATWWYLRDPTHVCFYSRPTLDWIAQRFSWRAEYPAANVVIFAR